MNGLKRKFEICAFAGLLWATAHGCADEKKADDVAGGQRAKAHLDSLFDSNWDYSPFDYLDIGEVQMFLRQSHDATQRWFIITCKGTEAGGEFFGLLQGSVKRSVDNGTAVIREAEFDPVVRQVANEPDPDGWRPQSIRQPAMRVEVMIRAQSDGSFAQGTVFVFSKDDRRLYVARWQN
jgi:hypothetical protein